MAWSCLRLENGASQPLNRFQSWFRNSDSIKLFVRVFDEGNIQLGNFLKPEPFTF